MRYILSNLAGDELWTLHLYTLPHGHLWTTPSIIKIFINQITIQADSPVLHLLLAVNRFSFRLAPLVLRHDSQVKPWGQIASMWDTHILCSFRPQSVHMENFSNSKWSFCEKMCGKGDINTLRFVVFIITALIKSSYKICLHSVYCIWIIIKVLRGICYKMCEEHPAPAQ